MTHMFKNVLFLFGIMFFLTACQNNVIEEVVNNKQKSYPIFASKENADTTKVSIDDALQVAKFFKIPETRSAKSVKGIEIVKDENEEAFMYVVNFDNNQGFILVSATKNYHPVLGWSDSGNYNSNSIPDVTNSYVTLFRENIKHLKNAPYDSLWKYRQEWQRYEKKQTKSHSSRSVSTEVQRFIENSIAEWENQGYEVSALSSNGFNLPTTEYQNAIIMAEMSMREDYMETSYIIKRDESEITNSISPMLDASWGQWSPYNETVKANFGVNYPVGCVAVALGQIMRYNEKPQTYNWDEMPSVAYLFENNYTQVAQLMYDIGVGVEMTYTVTGSGTHDSDALNYLRNVGYTNANLISHDASTVREQILNECPVYMSGTRLNSANEIKGHAWACDGLKDYYGRTVYYLMTLDYQEPLVYNSSEVFFENEWGDRYFHMNWGYDGDANGWFRDTNISFRLTGETEYRNYYMSRMNIINIY